ncbi:MAG: spore germination protein [Eubacteriales bacterium]|nr:spore germination protein [Eubacteriales bacterium]
MDSNINSIGQLEEELEKKFTGCADFISRKLALGNAAGLICCIREMADKNYIADKIIRPLFAKGDFKDFNGNFDGVLQTTAITRGDNIDDICCALCTGGALVAVDNGCLHAVICPADSYFGRSAGKSDTDITVRGPQTSFVDDIDKNVSSLRKIIRSPSLKIESFKKGNITNTRIALLFIEGRAESTLIDAARRKLNEISASVIVDSGNIESLIQNNRYGFFPSFGVTEKVDKAASLLASGRVVIICDGSPFIITAPYVFMESLQSAEDYLRSPYYATFSRLLRFASLLAALFLPALFLILVNEHPELLPTELTDIITEQREGIPFTLFIEVMLMLIVFEMLREVGVRMPRPVGNAVGLVGSIIIGDAATKAGVASTTVILIVAISAVANFIVPAYMNTTSILRLVFLTAAWLAGFAGLIFVSGTALCALCAKENLNTPYMSSITPFKASSMLDFIIAVPQKTLGRKEKP